MADWPAYVYTALYPLNYDDEEGVDEVMTGFVARWGGIDEPSLMRALRESDGFERTLAMYLLRDGRMPGAAAAIAPFLGSASRAERWRASLCLARLRDPRGLLAVVTMLTEALPDPQAYPAACAGPDSIERLRESAADLVAAGGDPSYVPALRHALQAASRLEAAFDFPPRPAPMDPEPVWDAWLKGEYDQARLDIHTYQESLVSALGRLGALGALTGLNLAGVHIIDEVEDAEERLDSWRVELLLGYLQDRYEQLLLPGNMAAVLRDTRWFAHIKDDETEEMTALLTTLGLLLRHVFGLSDEQVARNLSNYSYSRLVNWIERYREEHELERSPSDDD